ncbi:MAG TPA: GTP cyclohydrolase II RibA [Burkholderiaceae bacterium]|nr:GTP cyclohydrolase II RibA [Burkholderiaceae bacterium]
MRRAARGSGVSPWACLVANHNQCVMGDGKLSSILCGTREQAGASRALAEFRSGRPVIITGSNETLLCLPVEGLDRDRLAAFRALAAPTALRLVMTSRRARSLGIEASEPVAIAFSDDVDAQTVLALVAENKPRFEFFAEPVGAAAAAAIDLVKLAQVLPAVLVADTDPAISEAFDPGIITVDAQAVARFREMGMQSLAIAGEGHVPLASRVRTRFVVFRDSFGGDPVAVIVGAPNLSMPVPVRIHSACLTGDVFGSRRCDCGDQLRLALARLHEAGGGIILYLAQEGRGVGLANKMRTYQLQDAGLDTVDANTTLGFDDDERDYGVAVRMLHMLGATRVMLLTNNPDKLDSLAKAGIEISGRMPLETPVNADNRRYLAAKAARAGHHLGHVIAALSEPPKSLENAAPLAG